MSTKAGEHYHTLWTKILKQTDEKVVETINKHIK